MTSMDTWTMVQLRAECAKLGITPGRSKAETWDRIAAARQADEAIKARDPGRITRPFALRRYMAAARAAVPEWQRFTSAQQFTPRTWHEVQHDAIMAHARRSRLARGLCDFTALRTTLVGLPLVYSGALPVPLSNVHLLRSSRPEISHAEIALRLAITRAARQAVFATGGQRHG